MRLDTIMTWKRGGTVIRPTDHSRSDLDGSNERLGHSERMANGRLRKYHVADKRSWTVSWDMLPAPSDRTFDKRAGGKEIEKFYMDTKGEFQMTLTNKDADLDETITVVFTSFSRTNVKRGAYDIWNLSVGIEEV